MASPSGYLDDPGVVVAGPLSPSAASADPVSAMDASRSIGAACAVGTGARSVAGTRSPAVIAFMGTSIR
ncbi:hypothetical protein ABZ894_28375 [Nocardia beijingensis]|uniref:hypothetical protein n=1 Tax=Nocardia beijingensis TaxID=95162 RepID=UPI0033E4B98A